MTRRVTLVADSDAWGGAEVYLTHLLRRLPECGWQPSLVAAEPVADGFRAAAAEGALIAVPLARHRAAAPWLAAPLRRTAPDVVVVNLVDPGSNAAAVAAAVSVAPTVGVLHLAGDTGGRRDLRPLYARLAAALTPASGAAAQLVDELGMDPSRVHVVPNGIDVPPDPRGPAGSRPPRIGGLGRLTPQKGFDVLLDAARLLRAEGPAFDVVVGGEGRDGAALRAAAAGLPVAFPGFVTDVRGFLGGLDVFCLPSRREALPLVLLEAMAEGLPCVATDVGDVRAVVAGAAVVVPPGDVAALAGALRGLLDDPVRRAGLGAAARDRARHDLDAGLMARRTAAVLDGVLRSAHRPR